MANNVMINYKNVHKGSPVQYKGEEISWPDWPFDVTYCQVNTWEFKCTDPDGNESVFNSLGGQISSASSACLKWSTSDIINRRIVADGTTFTQDHEGTY